MLESELNLEARRVCNKKWYNPDYGVRNGIMRNKPNLDILNSRINMSMAKGGRSQV